MTRRRYDPNNADQVAEQQQAAELRQAQLEADIDWFISTPQGRRLFAGLCSLGGLERTPFVQNDALGTAFSAGRHALVLDVYNAVTRMGEREAVTKLIAEVFAAHGRNDAHDGRRR